MLLEDLIYFEQYFLNLKNDILNEVKSEKYSWLLAQKEDNTSLETETMARQELGLKLIGRQSFMLKKIDYSLFKIKNGTFGICDECDGDIEINRLKARPVATMCIHCKEVSERHEGNILYEKKSHTLGRGLKSNVISMDDFRDSKNVYPLHSGNF